MFPSDLQCLRCTILRKTKDEKKRFLPYDLTLQDNLKYYLENLATMGGGGGWSIQNFSPGGGG